MNTIKILAVGAIIILGVLFSMQKPWAFDHSGNRVLAEEGKSSDHSDVRQETDKPEPADTPELKDTEQEVEKIHQEIEHQVENKEVKNIEVAPSASESGAAVNIENQFGQNMQQKIPSSNNPVVTLQSANSGSVSINVAQNGVVTINNNGVIVTTQYPVLVNPAEKTLSIRTPSGVTVINTLPSQALNNLPLKERPTVLGSFKLNLQGNTPVYQAEGLQTRHLFGIIPVSADVNSTINAQDGAVINSQLPWFFQSLGFLFTT